jgi:SOS-response transcriptional repressor LexA
MTQSALQRRLEVRGGIKTQGAVSRWINGARIEPENARVVADELGYDRAFVLYLAGYGDEPVPDLNHYTMSGAEMDAAVVTTVAAAMVYQQRAGDDEDRSIPSIGRLSAGPGADNDHVVVRRPKWLARFPKNLWAAEVVGDCLTPDVLPGDVAVIDQDGSWGPNKVIAVRSGDGAQLKRFVRHEPGENDEPGRLVLTSNDGEFALLDNDADIIGVFVFAQRTIRLP